MEPVSALYAIVAAEAAAGYAYYKIAPRSFKKNVDEIKDGVKAIPGAVKHRVDQKLADMRLDAVRQVTDPVTGISQYRNEERDVVDFNKQVEDYEKIEKDIKNNPNRPYPPEFPT